MLKSHVTHTSLLYIPYYFPPNPIQIKLFLQQWKTLMMSYSAGVLVLFLISLSILTVAHGRLDPIKLPSEARRFISGAAPDSNDNSAQTNWAVLFAGSNGYENYRHQADVCHAYQILKKGGLKDENIVVFMYDDIANSTENPRPGVIINRPDGEDVYNGVPKDYVGDAVSADNLYAVILGNKTAVEGGSGKVVDSSPNDHIFIYYTDHGAAGVLGTPSGPSIYANDLNDVLKKKHASGTYKSLVFYLEACESGSIFEGLLPEGLNIYATTASNAEESSWATYCPGMEPSPPEEYTTCLGDLYSVAWLEDSDMHNLRTETLKQQYKTVKKRTFNNHSDFGSHVMQYGDVKLDEETLFLYMGTDSKNDKSTFADDNSLFPSAQGVKQRDADLLHFWHKFQNAPEGSDKKAEARNQLAEVMSHRSHIDNSVKQIGKILFGTENSQKIMNSMRPAGQPLVEDWDCIKSTVRTFEARCGSLSQYGLKHMRSFANICNAGVKSEQMAEASAKACAVFPSNSLSSLQRGFSA